MQLFVLGCSVCHDYNHFEAYITMVTSVTFSESELIHGWEETPGHMSGNTRGCLSMYFYSSVEMLSLSSISKKSRSMLTFSPCSDATKLAT